MHAIGFDTLGFVLLRFYKELPGSASDSCVVSKCGPPHEGLAKILVRLLLPLLNIVWRSWESDFLRSYLRYLRELSGLVLSEAMHRTWLLVPRAVLGKVDLLGR